MKTVLRPIRAARLLAGLRLCDAAAVAGCSSNFVSLVERGKRRMRRKIVKRLMAIYEINKRGES